jgi:quercetin dioxygenase-like cupin family protein
VAELLKNVAVDDLPFLDEVASHLSNRSKATRSKTNRSKENRSVALLKYCGKQTVTGKPRGFDIDRIIEGVWGKRASGDSSDGEVVKSAMALLRAELDRYYADGTGVDDERRFFAERKTYRITVQHRKVFPPVGNMEGANHITTLELANFLRGMCASGSLAPRELNSATRGWNETQQHSLKLRTNHEFEDLLARLSGGETEPLDFSAMRSLSNSLGVHSLILDSLLAKEETGDCLSMRLQEFFRPEADETHGIKAQYAVQNARYVGMGSNIVFLKLAPGGSSDVHSHSGDELMMAIEGGLEVRFHESGVRILLKPGEMVHFHAEQTHSAGNPSPTENSIVFIVRSYQTEGRTRATASPSRHQMREEICAALPEGKKLSSEAIGWILQSMAGRPAHEPDKKVPDQVRDQIGLARMIRSFDRPGAAREKDFLNAAAFANKTDKTSKASLDDFLQALETKPLDFSQSLLQSAIDMYRDSAGSTSGIYEALFVRFIFPGIPGVIVFRPEDPDSAHSHEIPKALFRADPGVVYTLPTRSLACSDIDLCQLALSPGHSTRINSHPGFELLLPVSGEANLRFTEQPDSKPVLLSSAAPTVTVFPSHRPHRISQSGEVKAVLLVIRFHGATPRSLT